MLDSTAAHFLSRQRPSHVERGRKFIVSARFSVHNFKCKIYLHVTRKRSSLCAQNSRSRSGLAAGPAWQKDFLQVGQEEGWYLMYIGNLVVEFTHIYRGFMDEFRK